MIYGQLSNLSGSGKISEDYLKDGETCYNAYMRAKGHFDEAPFISLIWYEKHAWCEAARAIRGL